MSPFHRSYHFSFSLPASAIPLGALSICLYAAYRSMKKHGHRDPQDNIVLSPLKTLLPKLSDGEVQGTAYPPDLFPGARDVETPFGSVRVYEWGPEKGRKVLLVHGISTPCLSLGLVAAKLVDSGCRVMLFDLFGRGYSDEPSDLKHDARLYTSQILIALASSPLAWTGTNSFSIVGYSLGGGIATSFTDTFPNLVESLVILAPSGIVRLSHIGWSSRFLYATEGYLPGPLIHFLVKQRLWGGTVSGKPKKSGKTDALQAVAAEAGDPVAPNEADRATRRGSGVLNSALFPYRPQISITSSVQWQITHHPGFIPAFISAIRYAPITNQHDSWKRIGNRLSAQKANSADLQAMHNGLWRSKVLLVLGKSDPIVIPSEVEPDATECFGLGNIETVIIDGGHDIPTSHANEVSRAMLRFWGEDSEKLDSVSETEIETGT